MQFSTVCDGDAREHECGGRHDDRDQRHHQRRNFHGDGEGNVGSAFAFHDCLTDGDGSGYGRRRLSACGEPGILRWNCSRRADTGQVIYHLHIFRVGGGELRPQRDLGPMRGYSRQSGGHSGECLATLTLTPNVPNTIAPGTYNIGLKITDSAGQPSHAVQLPLTVVPDFSVTSATSSQTLGAGQTTSGAYQLSVAPNPAGSSFPGAVTLSCTHGLPAGAQCIFAPSTPLTLGNSSAAVVMTVSTTTSQGAIHSPGGRTFFYALFLLLPGIVIGWSKIGRRTEKRRKRILAFVGLMLLVSLLSCGGVSNGGGSGTGIQPTTYQITVTGASAGTPADPGQSAVVTLVVN